MMRPLVLLFCIAGAAVAGPAPATETILDKELEPYLKELYAEVGAVQEGKKPVEQVVNAFRVRVTSEKNPRLKAIRHYVLGRLLMDYLKQEKEALDEFRAARKLHAKFPAVLGRLGQLANGSGDTKQARALFKQALDLEPSYWKAWYHLALLDAREERYGRAVRMLKKIFYEIDPSNTETAIALARLYTKRYRESYSEKRRKDFGDKAYSWADTFFQLEPGNGRSHLVLAQTLVDIGRIDKAVKVLRAVLASTLDDVFKANSEVSLYQIHVRRGQFADAAKDLRRLLKYDKIVKGKERAEWEQKIKDLEENGGRAMIIWQVQRQMKILQNEGHDAQSRRDALEILLLFYSGAEFRAVKELEEHRLDVLRSVIRALKNSPPELTLGILEFFQTVRRDPHLMRILVHFIYPNDDRNRTPDVRRSAVRTIATVAGEAALPTLYYCLRDVPGDVLREVDTQLSRLCQISSRVGGDGPLNEKQATLARNEWRAYFNSAEGSAKLVDSLAALRKSVEMDPGFNRSQKTKPMADHIAHTIVLDADAPTAAWLAGYQFLTDYLGKDFRELKERDQPVRPGDREKLTAAVEKFFAGAATPEELPVEKPSDETQEKAKEKE